MCSKNFQVAGPQGKTLLLIPRITTLPPPPPMLRNTCPHVGQALICFPEPCHALQRRIHILKARDWNDTQFFDQLPPEIWAIVLQHLTPDDGCIYGRVRHMHLVGAYETCKWMHMWVLPRWKAVEGWIWAAVRSKSVHRMVSSASVIRYSN